LVVAVLAGARAFQTSDSVSDGARAVEASDSVSDGARAVEASDSVSDGARAVEASDSVSDGAPAFQASDSFSDGARAFQASDPIRSQQPAGVFKSGIEVVELDVSVTRGGQPVQGLTAGDFALTDNGAGPDLQSV